MKALLAFALVVSSLGFLGCGGPARRHDARVDRRGDRMARTDERVTTRQDNRYDRRTDRHERIDSRFGY
jgi:hypothetical protein